MFLSNIRWLVGKVLCRCFSRARWMSHLALLCLLGFLGIGSPVWGCDDTLLTFLTADDPEGAFSKGIRELNKALSNLGNALNERLADQYQPLMVILMERWLGFSNRFLVNPPEKARGDVKWQSKMEECARRIGQIRRFITEDRIQAAHDATLALNGYLGVFFEAMGLPSDPDDLEETVKAALISKKIPAIRALRYAIAIFDPVIVHASDLSGDDFDVLCSGFAKINHVLTEMKLARSMRGKGETGNERC